ncbi:MAG TPA: hypothetical protein P5081_19875 [Phycisphaerae bacterium]|nr:hypothetical protein [Phycisphaerae bacterium]HRW55137.1 hypothetical protein [Phycisphaerae bacterium]
MRKRRIAIALVPILLVLFSRNGVAYAVPRFVKPGGTGNGLGNWSTATGDLQAAIDAANAGDEIRVAMGTYTPGAAPADSFVLKPDITIIGGYFASSANDMSRDPDPFSNNTILSGDLGGGVRSQQILSGAFTPGLVCTLQGMRVSGADENAIFLLAFAPLRLVDIIIEDNASSNVSGAGVFLDSTTILATNCHFLNNHGTGDGGAIYVTGAGVSRFLDCAFRMNSATARGGAIYADFGATIRAERTEFEDNSSLDGFDGGAIYQGGASIAQSDQAFGASDCVFINNQSIALSVDTFLGGGGAIALNGATFSGEIENCVFENNVAGFQGGAVLILSDQAVPAANIVNCRFKGNECYEHGGAMRVNGSVNVTNCIFRGNNVYQEQDAPPLGNEGTGGAVSHAFGALRIVNSTFSANEIEGAGGGLHSSHGASESLIANCIFRSNVSDAGDYENAQLVVPDVNDANNHLQVRNCNIQNLAFREYDLFDGQPPSVAGAGNFGTNPRFVDEFGLNDPNGVIDLSLAPDSPCIDAGASMDAALDVTDADDDGVTTGEFAPDIELLPRVLDGRSSMFDAACEGAVVDLGAHEFDDCNGNGVSDLVELAGCPNDPNCPDSNGDGILDVCQDCDQDGTPDPVEINACSGDPDCQDTNANCVPDGCDPDCNGNGIPDDLDIANCVAGDPACADCNLNGVPDACDEDCNGNGIPDDCELTAPADTKGREFIIGFLPGGFAYPPLGNPVRKVVELHLMADVETYVVVTYPMNSPTPTPTDKVYLTLKPNKTAIVRLPNDASDGWTAGQVKTNAVHVLADSEIRCLQMTRNPASTDGAIGYPVDALGLEYIAVTANVSQLVGPFNPMLPAEGQHSEGDKPQFVVIATRDNTNVTIIPTDEILDGAGGVYAAGEVVSITLMRGEGYLVQPNVNYGDANRVDDLTGSIILADQPVYVMNGNLCTNIPAALTACDTVFESAHPVAAWGDEFVAPALPVRGGVDYASHYRIVAAQDDTTILRDGVVIGTIDRGEFIEEALTGSHVFSSQDKEPIFVVQFMPSSGSNSFRDHGDPAQLNLLPAKYFANQYEFSNDIELVQGVVGGEFVPDSPHHFVTIVAHEDDVSQDGVAVDGVTLPSTEFTPIGLSDYQFATVTIDRGRHVSTSVSQGHYAIVGGWGDHDSYLYPAGAAHLISHGVENDCNANGLIDSCEIATEPGDRILYVDRLANGFGDGRDWESAFNSLQDAIAAAAESGVCDKVGEIRVAQGTYRPDDGVGYTPGDRTHSFHLLTNVAIRGGYAGLAETNPDVRDLKAYKSVLEGDLGLLGDPTDNTEHVVVADGLDTTAILDGFLILHGYTDGEGGGLRISNGSATITNCRIEDNEAFLGGGVYCLYADPNVVNCRITFNAAYLGAGLSNWNSSPNVTNCLVAHNTGIEPGVGGGGGMYNTNSNAVVTNCTFADNASDFPGAGIYNYNANVTVSNCVLWSNKYDCDSIPCLPEDTQINYDGTPGFPIGQVTYSCIEDDLEGQVVFPGFGNTDKNPEFQNHVDYRLSSGSSCIDSGDNDRVPLDVTDIDGDGDGSEQTPLDIDLSPRFTDDPHMADIGNGTAPIVDMGCYEFEAPGLLMGGSGMSHGGAGDYVVSPGAIESRVLNGAMTIVFSYDRPVYSSDADAFVVSDFTAINASVDSVVQSPSLDTIELTCSGVTNETCVALSFVVESEAGNEVAAEFTWRVLEGDVTGDGVVDKYDWEAIKALDGQVPTKDEYRCDLDGDGLIEGSNSAPFGDDYALAIAAEGDAVSVCEPEVMSIASRRTHKAKYFDIDKGEVEPRAGVMQIVFTFDREMRSADGDAFAVSDFAISSGAVLSVKAVKTWDSFIVEVENVADADLFTVLFDAEDMTGYPIQVQACWPILRGDVNGDGEVDAADADLISNADGADLDNANFRADLDVDGFIEGVAPSDDDLDICTNHVNNEVDACGG